VPVQYPVQYLSWWELNNLKKSNMKRILKNIKTSFFGSIAGGSLIIDGIAEKNWITIIAGIAAAITGLLAKDSDVQ
jgi:hypothetical protein